MEHFGQPLPHISNPLQHISNLMEQIGQPLLHRHQPFQHSSKKPTAINHKLSNQSQHEDTVLQCILTHPNNKPAGNPLTELLTSASPKKRKSNPPTFMILLDHIPISVCIGKNGGTSAINTKTNSPTVDAHLICVLAQQSGGHRRSTHSEQRSTKLDMDVFDKAHSAPHTQKRKTPFVHA